MIPNIRFRYSWIYDESYRNSPRIKARLEEKGEKYPSIEKIRKYIIKIEPIWRKMEKRILEEIKDITGLKWKEKDVICYTIGFGRPISDPLTVKVFKNKNDFIDTLTHEMIHQIHGQDKKYWKWKLYLNEKYKNEPITTRNHIALHAIHKEIYIKLFGEKRLQRDIKRCLDSPEYKRAWEIVEKEGHNNIIKKFKEVTK